VRRKRRRGRDSPFAAPSRRVHRSASSASTTCRSALAPATCRAWSAWCKSGTNGQSGDTDLRARWRDVERKTSAVCGQTRCQATVGRAVSRGDVVRARRVSGQVELFPSSFGMGCPRPSRYGLTFWPDSPRVYGWRIAGSSSHGVVRKPEGEHRPRVAWTLSTILTQAVEDATPDSQSCLAAWHAKRLTNQWIT